MQQTETYKLNLIEGSDTFSPQPLNENMEAIEGILQELTAGQVRVAAGTYEGTGIYGYQTPCTLTFDFEPKLVMVYEEDMGFLFGDYGSNAMVSNLILAPKGAVKARRYTYTTYPSAIAIYDCFAWSGNSFSWYSYTNAAGHTESARTQLNETGKTYHYFAVG